MATTVDTSICLEVAVDHRLRRLFKRVPSRPTESSNHVVQLERRGRFLDRSTSEIQVTKELAGPPTKGGIAVVLQQPRDNHPFRQGIDEVIRECESLWAIYDVFRVVSRGTLDIRNNVTVVDLLPYVPEKAESVDELKLRESFETTEQVICEKKPDVLLCAGRIWLPRAGKFNHPKGNALKFESMKVGEKFESRPEGPWARIRTGEGEWVRIRKVNGFHPSSAVNYHPHISYLRQLQILAAAETCGVFRGDWENQDWMDQLRSRCRDYMDSHSETSSRQTPSPQSPGRSPGRRSSNRYIPDYQQLYSDKLLDVQNRAEPAMLNPNLTRLSTRGLYQAILALKLGEMCNDASLLLGQLHRLERKGWPDSVAELNEAALTEAAMNTMHFVRFIKEAAKKGNALQLTDIMDRGARSVLRHVEREADGQYKLDTRGACQAFLKLATEVESLLMELLENEEAEEDEALSSMMGQMNLGAAPAAERVRRLRTSR